MGAPSASTTSCDRDLGVGIVLDQRHHHVEPGQDRRCRVLVRLGGSEQFRFPGTDHPRPVRAVVIVQLFEAEDIEAATGGDEAQAERRRLLQHALDRPVHLEARRLAKLRWAGAG